MKTCKISGFFGLACMVTTVSLFTAPIIALEQENAGDTPFPGKIVVRPPSRLLRNFWIAIPNLPINRPATTTTKPPASTCTPSTGCILKTECDTAPQPKCLAGSPMVSCYFPACTTSTTLPNCMCTA